MIKKLREGYAEFRKLMDDITFGLWFIVEIAVAFTIIGAAMTALSSLPF